MQPVSTSFFKFIITGLKSVGFRIGNNGLFVFKKRCSFKKAVGLTVNQYGIIFSLCGLMMFPDCGEASPYGTMTIPHGIMMIPHGLITVPDGMITSPHGMITSPFGLKAVPYGMITKPHGMMMIPYGTMMIPSDISGVPNVGFNHLPRLDAGLMKLFQQ